MEIAPGDFFYHNEFGIGQVIRVFERTVLEAEIQFKDRPMLLMTENLIQRSMVRVSPQGFRALIFNEPDRAHKMILENPVEVLLLVLEDSPGYKAKTEDIKEYLAPYIKTWDFWWEKTQPLLKEDHRIDTTNSKLREYALAREVRSQAEEAYLAFRFAKQRSSQPDELVDRARAALSLHQKGEVLPAEHATELLDFLKQIVYFEKYDISLRLTTLFRLQADKWITLDESQEWSEKLLGRGIRLYEMEIFTCRRVIDELLKSPLGDREIKILASGMCVTNESVMRYLLAWATKRGNLKILGQFLIIALSENHPPFLGEEKYSSLRDRFESCLSLVKSLPDSFSMWSEVFSSFKRMSISLSAVKPDALKFLLPAFVNLAFDLNKRNQSFHPENTPTVIESLTDPTYPIEFILAILDTSRKNEKTKDLVNEIESYLFENAELRRDNFLSPLITAKWDNYRDQISQLIKIVHQYNSIYLTEYGGSLICDFARQAHEEDLIELLPYLDQLRRFEGNWSWRTTLESLREKGYLVMFQDSIVAKGYRDEALINAAQQVVNFHVQETHQELINQREQLKQSQEQAKNLQILIDQKDAVLRELRGNVGGDTEEARFEERSRILKEFVNSIAEFERFAASQPGQSREIEAVIKRFSSILSSYKVTTTEAIGTQVTFNPQKHRLIEVGEILPGGMVVILERGYLIRDHKEKLRLLKPALVKKV